ncbi:MAG: helix-turn-helix transcriptional regulator [Bryobacterales bacterium]|nr:helix-turn-helix transcriptional regulator [Bryobacterales bacterium]
MNSALEIISLIYDAVADSSVWQTVLDTFIQATQGIGGSLFVGDPNMDEFAFVRRHRMSEEEAALYIDRYAATDGWALRIPEMPEGTVVASHDIWPEAEMEQSPAYREFYGLRHWHYGMGGIFLRTPTSISAITMIREKEKGPCGERELTLLRTLVPHLRRAALLHGELSSLRSQRKALLGHLDRYPQAFLLIDTERRVLATNTPGREIINLGDGLRAEAGQLRTTSAKEDAAFRRVVQQIASDRNSRVSPFSVTRPSQRSSYRLLLMPVPDLGAAPLSVPQPAVAIVIVDADRPFSPDTFALRELFAMTPSEIKVTSLLVQGRNMDEISRELGISIETVRTHIRRAFSKTATNRQGELIALVLRSVPFQRL